MNEANYQDGQSVLLQSRAATAMIEWEYTDGQSGQIGAGQASETPVTKTDAGFFFP